MFCLNCGTYNEDGLRFCTYCGARLGGPAQQPQSMTYTMPVTPGDAGNQIDPSTFSQQEPDHKHNGGILGDPGYTGPQRVVDPSVPIAPTIDANKRSTQVTPFLIGLISSFVVFGLVALLLLVGPLKGLVGGGAQEEPAAVEPPAVEPPADEPPTEEPPIDSGDDPAPPADDPSVTGVDETDAPPYKAGLSDYSWEELSQIAGLIESCTRSSDALSIAQDYNLVNPSGTYPNKTKTIKMSDGKKVRMELVGVWHDSADTESGKAGLSFLAIDCVYSHRMASGTTTPGGWQGSEVRSWLQSDIYAKLPSDIAENIVPAYKMSNNTGKTSSVSSVTQTVDTLWIPSIPEICGPVNWTYTSNPSNSSFYNAVFNAEGTQYEAFAQKGIRSEDSNACLQLGQGWWLRSTAASTGRGRHVSPEGDPSQFGDSNVTWGVAFGFCL